MFDENMFYIVSIYNKYTFEYYTCQLVTMLFIGLTRLQTQQNICTEHNNINIKTSYCGQSIHKKIEKLYLFHVYVNMLSNTHFYIMMIKTKIGWADETYPFFILFWITHDVSWEVDNCYRKL